MTELEAPPSPRPAQMGALMRQLYDTCDITGRGKITLDEFRPVAQELAGDGVAVDGESVKAMFQRLGPDSHGFVDFPAFASGMSSAIHAKAEEIFDLFDEDDDGVLNLAELTATLELLLGADTTPSPSDAARSLLERYDTAHVGGLNRSLWERVFLRIAASFGADDQPDPACPPLSATPSPHVGRKQTRASLILGGTPAAGAGGNRSRRRTKGAGYVLEHNDMNSVAELEAKGLTHDEIAEMRAAFQALDTRRLGTLGTPELRVAFPENDADLALTLLDRNWSGDVEFNEFALALAELRSTGAVSGVPLKVCKELQHIVPLSVASAPAGAQPRPDASSTLELQIKVDALEVAAAKARETQRVLERSLRESLAKCKQLEASLDKSGAANEELGNEVAKLTGQLAIERKDAEELRRTYKRLEQELLADAFAAAAPGPEDSERPLSLREKISQSHARQVRELEAARDEMQRQLKAAVAQGDADRNRFRDQEKRYLAELEKCRQVIDETRKKEREAKHGLEPRSPASRRGSIAQGMSLGEELQTEEITVLDSQLDESKKRVSGLETELAALRREFDRARKDDKSAAADERDRVRRDLEAQIAELRKQLGALSADKSALEKTLEDKRREAKSTAEERDRLRRDLEAQLADLHKQLSALSADRAAVDKALEAKRGELAAAVEERDRARRELEVQVADLRRQLSSLGADKASLEAALEDRRLQLERLTAQEKKTKEELEEKKRNVRELEAKIYSLEAQIKAAAEREQQSGADRKDHDQKVSELEAAAKDLRQRLGAAEDQLAQASALGPELDKAKETIAELRAQVASADAAARAAKDRVTELEHEVLQVRMGSQHARKASENEAARLFGELQKMTSEAKSARDKLASESQAASQRLAEAEERASKLAAEVQVLRGGLERAQSEEREAARREEALKKQLQEAKEAADRNREGELRSQSDAKAAQDKASHLEGDLRDLAARLADAESRLASAEAALAAARGEADKRARESRDQLDAGAARAAQLQRQIDELKQQLRAAEARPAPSSSPVSVNVTVNKTVAARSRPDHPLPAKPESAAPSPAPAAPAGQRAGPKPATAAPGTAASANELAEPMAATADAAVEPAATRGETADSAAEAAAEQPRQTAHQQQTQPQLEQQHSRTHLEQQVPHSTRDAELESRLRVAQQRVAELESVAKELRARLAAAEADDKAAELSRLTAEVAALRAELQAARAAPAPHRRKRKWWRCFICAQREKTD
eukprot:m51a1_g3529 hypothetical protein (1247) ;mRNA; f:937442-941663